MESSCAPAPPSLEQREELIYDCSKPVGRTENDDGPGPQGVKQQGEPGQRAAGCMALEEEQSPGSLSRDFCVFFCCGCLCIFSFFFFF